MRWYNAYVKKAFVIILLVLFGVPARVIAQPSSSSNYRVEESSFSSGSGINSNSANYNARASAGNLGVGSADSTNYNARPGFVTPDEEFLELVVQTSSVDLGTLLTNTTGSGTAQFYVRSYINGSYYVQTMSSPPTSEGGAVLSQLATNSASTQGTEQFGINLVANTTPAIGTSPVHDPSSAFANGIAATNYDTANSYRYNVGETIAQSGSSGPAWGLTNYTVSYIANVSSITEAGTYTMNHDIVVTATY